jgi:hypothetical protein
MTTMITLNEIENKIVLILMAAPNVIYTQYTLYDRLIEKFDVKEYKADVGFKAKYFLVLNNLDKKYDNIKVQNVNNRYILSYEDNDVPNVVSNTSDVQQKESIIDTMNNLPDNNEMCDSSYLANFIITNNLKDHYNYVDGKTGNTILHEVLALNNVENVKNILKENLNVLALNKKLESPFEKITSIQVSNVVLLELFKINQQNKILLDECNNIIIKHSITIDMLNDKIKKISIENTKKYSYFNYIVKWIIGSVMIHIFFEYYVPKQIFKLK